MSRPRPRKLLASSLALAAIFVFVPATASARAGAHSLDCEYVESGPLGAVGNFLSITGNDNAQVRREGDLVLVGTSAGNGPRDFEAVPCGEQATVTNLDRIVYRGTAVPPRDEHQFLLDEREGPLGPGATPEAVDSEIEVEVLLPDQPRARPRVQLVAGDGRNDVRVDGGAGQVAVSLEPHPGGAALDPDLVVSAPPRTVDLKIHGGGGGDVLDARPLDPRRGLLRSLLLAGDDGKDAILGTARGDQLQGGPGPDRLFGRGGRDFLYPSAGADTTVGGAGDDFISGERGPSPPDAQPDVYLGGAGKDFIDARRGGRDEVDCGADRDEAVLDREDILRHRGGCEALRGPAGE